MTTTTETLPPLETLRLRPESAPASDTEEAVPEYKYARFLPHFDNSVKYPPLTDFEHVDPGHEALKLENPREFLQNAEVANVRFMPCPLRNNADLHPS
jgi:sulfonate dioxygenase